MDSDDDMYDSGDAEDADSDNDDAEDHTFIDKDTDGADVDAASHERSYTVLEEKDIRQRIHNDTEGVSTLLSVSRAAASLLLGRYNWSVNGVQEAWFNDEEGVRKAVGLFENPAGSYSVRTGGTRLFICSICFENYSIDSLKSTPGCCHLYCTTCWKSYISTSIDGGPGCLTLRCPDPSCSMAVGGDMIELLASEEDKGKYDRYVLRSYVEQTKWIKWCPGPGCECAVEYEPGSGSYDVRCLCLHRFCWNCAEEAHRPVDCDTVAKWMLKNKDEAANTKWILVNSKPCPKCKRPIEKNKGCMHVTCSAPCKYEFCWLCLGEFHNTSFACNRYNKDEHAEDERRRDMAKKPIQRYAHYYERWAANLSAMRRAVAGLRRTETTKLEKLGKIVPESRLGFVREAWLQIAECRRVLSWTYAYGYYLDEREFAKKQFFEYLQGEAEAGLERLHQCTVKELKDYLVDDTDYSDTNFRKFRAKVSSLTTVTGNYFENLVKALENGLSDVDVSRWTCNLCTSLNKRSTMKCKMCRTGKNPFGQGNKKKRRERGTETKKSEEKVERYK